MTVSSEWVAAISALISRALGAVFRVRVYSAATTACSISAPAKPSQACARAVNVGGLSSIPRLTAWMRRISARVLGDLRGGRQKISHRSGPCGSVREAGLQCRWPWPPRTPGCFFPPTRSETRPRHGGWRRRRYRRRQSLSRFHRSIGRRARRDPRYSTTPANSVPTPRHICRIARRSPAAAMEH